MAANVGSNYFKKRMIAAAINGETIKVALLMTNSDFVTDPVAAQDPQYVGDFSTLDECDSTGYVRKEITITANVNLTADRGEAAGPASVVWANLPAGSRSMIGLLVMIQGPTGDSDSPWSEFLGFAAPRAANGKDFTVQFDAGGGDVWRVV